VKYIPNEEMTSLYHNVQSSGLGPGTQINVNHDNCPAGQDTKGRLYIRMTDDGSKLLAYCHHCGCKGVKQLTRLARQVPSSSAAEVIYTNVSDPTHIAKQGDDNNRWNFWLGVWDKATPYSDKVPDDFFQTFPGKFFSDPKDFFILQERKFYGMRLAQIGTSGMALVPRMGENALLGLDARQCDLTSGAFSDRPKWRRVLATSKDWREVAGKLIVYNNRNNRIGVVVEDPISAMRVDIAGYAGIALTCSVLSSEDAFKLSILFDKIVIWLDNDNATVKAQATSAASKLMMYGVEVYIVNGKDDPKRHTTEEIATTLIHALNPE